MRIANFFVGRFNPPTKKHFSILENMIDSDGDYYLFIVDGEKSSKDKIKNPLSFNLRKRIFSSKFKNIKIDYSSSAFQCLDILYLLGYQKVIWWCGEDREKNYLSISKSYLEMEIEIKSIIRNDGISSSKLKELIYKNNDVTELLPSIPNDLKDLIIRKVNESTNHKRPS